MDVDALAPGRTLDALVAEKVMGWIWVKDNHGVHIEPGSVDDCDCKSHAGGNECLPYYSTNIAAAWEIVESVDHGVIEDGAYQFAVHVREVFISRYAVTREGSHFKSDCIIIAHAEGETTAHAICLAVKAMEGEGTI